MTIIKAKKCDLCPNKRNHLTKLRGDLLCNNCFRKRTHYIPPAMIPLDEAQGKVRRVYLAGRKLNPHCIVNLPLCYQGHIVKVIVTDDKETSLSSGKKDLNIKLLGTKVRTR